MGLASVVQHSVKAPPLKHDTPSLRVSPVSASKRTRVSLPRSHFSSSFAVIRGLRGQYCPVACTARGTEQEDDLSTSGVEGPASWEHDDDLDKVNSFSSSQASSYVDKQGQRSHGHETYRTSIQTVVLCVCAAVAFGIGVGLKDGAGKATEFFTGYILEQSLSVDNLFVFVLIFKYFKVPLAYQNQVLSYGIAGAIVFRSSLILLGTATLQRFEAVNLLLAVVLLYSSFKLFASEEDDTDLSNNFVVKTCQRFIPVTSSYDGNRFITSQNGVWKATPLLLTVAVIELSDIAFAVDSIPAVFGVTRDPFIVFTSNIFAILGLRSLYTLISEGMAELEYLQPSISVVLGFIGCKMILDFFGFHVSTEVSLGFVATSLSAGVLLSLMKKSD